jgi:two-component system, chemotaxis family, sensor kinase Cph1
VVTSPSNERSIQTPGSIQPHGVLIVLEEQDFKVLQVSRNTQQYLGRSPAKLQGERLSNILDEHSFRIFQSALPKTIAQPKALQLSISGPKRHQSFDAHIHRTDVALILELEPRETLSEDHPTYLQGLLNETIARMQTAKTVAELLQIVVEDWRQLTEYDRVHIYRFDDQEAGEVIAEAKRKDLSSYLGLHFPEMDIPPDSRALYARGLLRYIPDICEEPVKLSPVNHPKTHKPLNLGAAVLRSVDPCCVEYYQNMGSSAALILSILKDGKLWGLISCHHQTPKLLSCEMRNLFRLLGHITCLELGNKIRQEALNIQANRQALHSDILTAISRADNFVEALMTPGDRLLGLVNAQGAAICLGDNISLVGQTPLQAEVHLLMEFLDALIAEDLFYTDALVNHYPEASVFKDIASGVLLLWISRVERYCIFWFRPEVLQSINWAGNPLESFQQTSDGKLQLGPRQSFDLWQERVQGHSLPWKSTDIESAQQLKSSIVGIVLRKAEELARLNLELEQSNRELAAFSYSASHDLKEPLRGIYNYSSILQEDYGDRLDEEGLDYLQIIMQLSQRMDLLINGLLRLSQLRQEDLKLQAVDLNQLVDQVIEMLQASRPHQSFDIRIPSPLPSLNCDPDLLREVFSNLIRNAIKYNDHDDKWVEIGIANSIEELASSTHPSIEKPPTVLYVRDNGIGIRPQHQEMIFKLFKRLHAQEMYGGGAGAGLAIVKLIIERHGGWIWLESLYGEGTTFYFTLS